jgi:hypothetical protein
MPRERVLITVKTYPTLSRKYGETVCTAGVRADGTWMRIYPVPFRRLEEQEQYKKFDWVEADFIAAVPISALKPTIPPISPNSSLAAC